jgi:3-methyladenine DNA glycosylase AlkD
MFETLQISLKQYASIHRAQRCKKFFKIDTGAYAEHDQFLGVAVPTLRIIARQFSIITLNEIECLITSVYNEERLLALFILIIKYKKSPREEKEQIFQFFLQYIDHINNWNLVDSSAHILLGAHIFHTSKDILLSLAQSYNMWHRRIAIVATWYFIRHNQFEWTIKIAILLHHDSHDLIHKSVGWMLREIGKRNQEILNDFLEKYATTMPRTMLRYAIEKYDQPQRDYFLSKKRTNISISSL